MGMSSLMDLQYDETIVDRVRQMTPKFAERAAEVDRNSRFPIENFNELSDAGLNAVCIPREWNGAGANSLTYNLILLEDDRHAFPPYFAAPVVREAVLEAYPELRTVLAPLTDLLDDKTMRALNWQVDGEKKSPRTVAREFLRAKDLLAAGNKAE